MIAHYEPFPGTAQVGLEVAPSGPYAVLLPPWSTSPVNSSPPPFSGLLGPPGRTVGIRLSATILRISGRWSMMMETGGVHLRGFDRDGKMLWRGRFAKIEGFEMSMSSGTLAEITFDLLFPGDMVTV